MGCGLGDGGGVFCMDQKLHYILEDGMSTDSMLSK